MNKHDGWKTLRKRSWGAVWLLAVGVICASEGEAWAQKKGAAPKAGSAQGAATAASAPKEVANAEAEKHFDAGLGLVEKDKWSDAYVEFRAAYEASPESRYLAALIKAEIATGREPEAATHLTLLLRQSLDLSGPTVTQAQGKLAELRSRLGVMRIEVNVDGAEVLVDGKVVGTSPLEGEIFVEPGPHKIEARKAGLALESMSAPIEVKAGTTSPVRLTLAEKKEAPKKMGGPNKTLVYAGIGVAGALALVGVGTAIGAAVAEKKSLDDWNQADCTAKPLRSCYDNFDVQENKRFLLGNTAVWTFIGAGAVGVGTLVYALVTKESPEDPPKPTISVTPTVGGIVVLGTF